MKRKILRFYNYFYYRFLIFNDPSLFAKKIGVNVEGRLHIYGADPGMFGSEPWLITLGDNVHIVGGTRFINHDGGVLILRHKYKSLEITKQIIVGNNVYIGLNSIIMPGVTIGSNVIIGAGSIVNKDVPSDSVYAGVPAKYIKSLDEYLLKVQEESLDIGHLNSIEKERKLKQIFNIK
jgi:acetyltransferase-like isoleucine patch superfamily enzyme